MLLESEKHFGFAKGERLCGRETISSLFKEGEGRVIYPFRIVQRRVDREGFPVCILLSVAKKRFKHAVDRNRIKRLIRETYRLNKSILWNSLREKDYSLHIAFVYIGEKVEKFPLMQEKMIKVLTQIKEHLGE
ncbi:MAG TPA: ribonuclease P protein component [Porphyromonadaceae bacterium]|nr:ribonuclease P protein component [Porphyromonadaceae bacterium]